MNRVTYIFLLFGILHLAGVFIVPGLIADGSELAFLRRNWGYHFLAYYPLPVVGLAYAVFAASLLPSLQTRAIRVVTNVSLKLRRYQRFTVCALISLVSAVVLWSLRQKYPFLGDGHIRTAELSDGIVHTSGWMFIRFLLFVSTTFELSGRETYQIVNTALGVPFVFLVLCVSNEIGSNALSRVTAAILIGFSGLLQYYAGYMEVYALLPILMLSSIWLALRAETNPLFGYGAAAVAGAAFLIHPLSCILIPPSIYLVWHVDISRRGRRPRSIFFVLLAAGAGIAYLGHLFKFAGEVLMPLLPAADQDYAVLTIANFWERLNGLVLCVPAALPLAALMMQNPKAITLDTRTRYLLLAGVVGATSVFVFDFVLGSQDWDVMALAAFPVSVFAAHTVSRFPQDVLRSVALPIAALCLLSTVPWIITNHTDASVDRLEDTVIKDPAGYFKTHNRAVRVSLALLAEDRRQAAIDVLDREVLRAPDDPQVLYNLATIRFGTGQYEQTIPTARASLRIQPYNVGTYRMLMESLWKEGRNEEAEQLARDHSEILIAQANRAYAEGDQNTAAMAWGAAAFMDLQDPATLSRSPDALGLLVSVYRENASMDRPIPFRDMPEKMRTLARRSYTMGNPVEAIQYWQAARLMGLNDPALYQNLGTVQYQQGRPGEAETTWKQGIKENPKAADLMYNLANFLGEQGRTEEAATYFEAAIAAAPDSADFYLQYGRLLVTNGMPLQAQQIFDQGLVRIPGSVSLSKAISELTLEHHYKP